MYYYQHASTMQSEFLVPVSSQTASCELALHLVIPTYRHTLGYTVTEGMDGALYTLMTLRTTGFRLTSEKLLKCVVLLPRETSMAMNGLQNSCCHSHPVEIAGKHTRI